MPKLRKLKKRLQRLKHIAGAIEEYIDSLHAPSEEEEERDRVLDSLSLGEPGPGQTGEALQDHPDAVQNIQALLSKEFPAPQIASSIQDKLKQVQQEILKLQGRIERMEFGESVADHVASLITDDPDVHY